MGEVALEIQNECWELNEAGAKDAKWPEKVLPTNDNMQQCLRLLILFGLKMLFIKVKSKHYQKPVLGEYSFI